MVDPKLKNSRFLGFSEILKISIDWSNFTKIGWKSPNVCFWCSFHLSGTFLENWIFFQKSDIWNLANAEVSQIPDTRFSISGLIFTKFCQKRSNMCFCCPLSLSWPVFKIWIFFEKSSFFMILVGPWWKFRKKIFSNIFNIPLWVDYEFT